MQIGTYKSSVGRIPDETIELVLASTDIVDLVSSYLPLKRAGSAFKANCPFHNEKTPSFTVNPARQSYHCFGCGAGGSAIGFVMEYENLPFPDAVKKLATRAGVVIQEEAHDPQADQRRRRKSRLLELHNGTAKFMHEQLMSSPEAQHARDYLKSRGYGRGMAERWLVGWMPNNPNTYLDWARSSKFTGRELCDSGIAMKKDAGGLYVRFRDRLMFPIHNDYGDIIAFSGRQLREDPRSGKYINSPETPLFKKSKVFFALDKARRSMTKDKFALLCEGQIDVIACHEAGITSAIATLGTACTPDHARLLKRYTSDVVLCFDSDNAGFKAADKAFAIMSAEGMNLRMVAMPEGEDPDSLMKSQGTETFRNLVDHSRDYFEVKLEHEISKRDLTSVRERAALANELAVLVAHVDDKMTKDALINQVSTRLEIGVEELRSGVVRAEKQKGKTQFYETRQQARDAQEQDNLPKALPTPINGSVSYLCHLALTSQEAQDWLGEQLESLSDPLASLPGGSILRHILSRSPDPTKPAAVQTFIGSMREEDQLALRGTLAQDAPANPVRAAEETTAMLVSTHFQNKEAAIRARLREPNLAAEEMIRLMNEAKDLQEILKNLQQRFIR
ncbi:DNA primase [Verrucomicrobiaceae bacterium 5K15]|uniref:DNA primase n=1 Tax=Oceaniferula flava TaxID=2800421 RepID=A0AAE2S9P7_9BACT|nr:DNA primase [Oceaniferula flavus]MBK1853414.1 DNA primase [Oceaniferula flavus]MBM1134719.1 DNA primase [Oceaniferula flavus]